MKPVSFFAGVLLTLTLISCGADPETKTEQQVKEEMPAELKDSSALIKDEQSALDKLNNAMDSTQKQ